MLSFLMSIAEGPYSEGKGSVVLWMEQETPRDLLCDVVPVASSGGTAVSSSVKWAYWYFALLF